MGSFPRVDSPIRWGSRRTCRRGSCATPPAWRRSSPPSSKAAPGPPTRWRWRAPCGSPPPATSRPCLDLDARLDAMRWVPELRAASVQMGRQTLRDGRDRGRRALPRRICARGGRRSRGGPPRHGVRGRAGRPGRRPRGRRRRVSAHDGRAHRQRGAAAPPARAGRGPARARRRAPAHRRLAARAGAGDVDDLWSFTPGLEIAGLRHADLEARLFRS